MYLPPRIERDIEHADVATVEKSYGLFVPPAPYDWTAPRRGWGVYVDLVISSARSAFTTIEYSIPISEFNTYTRRKLYF